MAPSGLSPLLPAYQRPLPAPSQQGGHSCHDTTVQQVAPATFSGWPSVPIRGLAPIAQEELASVVLPQSPSLPLSYPGSGQVLTLQTASWDS